MTERPLGRRGFLKTGILCLAGTLLTNRILAAEAASTTVYIVKPGDTLSEIALRHGITVKQLKEFNGLSGDKILPKQELKLVSNKDSFTHLKRALSEIDEPRVTSGHWKNIIVHHSATPFGNAAIFHRFHLQERRMENGLAYHFVIGNGTNSRNGQVEVGVRWKKQLPGGHVASLAYNENSIGICLVGNFQTKRPTESQLESTRQLITYIRSYLVKTPTKFLVHKDIEKTLCPGQYFPRDEFHRRFA